MREQNGIGQAGSGLSPSPAKVASRSSGGGSRAAVDHQLQLQQRLHQQQYLLHQRQRGRNPGTPSSAGSVLPTPPLPPPPPPSPATPDTTGPGLEIGAGTSTVIIHGTPATPTDGTKAGTDTVIIHTPVPATTLAPTTISAPTTPAPVPAPPPPEPATPVPTTPAPPATPAGGGRHISRLSAMLSGSARREHRQGVLGPLQLQERLRGRRGWITAREAEGVMGSTKERI
ncbi:hypothetical protein QBC36DRAFT_369983 [Triangularia setosa]|uniref:Uncharacterized protein n=1 Tax=Triangularia setosa TaxID=2587417 RepID=A0AAN7A8F9_9PEZI|nr:hypothetical protein QBC36DRAFT_369983 [Podospora setosa]